MNVIRIKQLTGKVGLNRMTILCKAAAGSFPKPFKLGDGDAVGWLVSEIDEWIAKQAAIRS